jgi:nicotinamidase-related amidase
MTNEKIEPINPAKTALLVQDLQNGILGHVPEGEQLIAGVKHTIELLRSHGVTIGYVRVGFADGDLDNVPATSGMAKRVGAAAGTAFHADAYATQIHEDIAPQQGDIVVRKTRIGPFGSTDLHEQLQARGIDTLTITGIATSGVVISTVRDAYDRDYRLIVLSDQTADSEPDVQEFLVTRLIPKQAEVITAAQLPDLM